MTKTEKLPEDKVVAFIDILGFKEILKKIKTVADYDDLEGVFLSIKDNIDDVYKEMFPDILNCNIRRNHSLEATIMSDAIVISARLEDHLLLFLSVGKLVNILLKKGIFVRGGITKGFLHYQKRIRPPAAIKQRVTKSMTYNFVIQEDIVFGNALTRAYEMETKEAIYPRIVIDEVLVQCIEQMESERLKGKMCIIPKMDYGFNDNDGAFIFNFMKPPYFSKYLHKEKNVDPRLNQQQYYHEVKVVIQKLLDEKDSPSSIKLKKKWLANFFNRVLPDEHKEVVGLI